MKRLNNKRFDPFESIDEAKEQKMMNEISSLVENLDEYCINLLLFFRQRLNESFGFNQLLKELEKMRGSFEKRFSRRVLSLHLKHLLEKHIIEVKEIKESRLKIKPRKYSLSPYWKNFFETLDGLKTPEKILEEFKGKPIEEITASIIETSIDFCTRSFEEILLAPKFWGATESRYYSNLVEKLARIYQKVVYERKEKEKALQTLKEINELLKNAMREKYILAD